MAARISALRKIAAPRARLAAGLVAGTFNRATRHNIEILAAGVAFYAFLSIFPAMAGVLMVWGMFAEPAHIRDMVSVLRTVAPPQAFDLVVEQMVRISMGGPAGFTFGALVSLCLVLWSGSRAAFAMMSVLNVAYAVDKRRGFFASNFVAIRFTVVLGVFSLLSIMAIAAVPPILEALRLGAVVDALLRLLRWGVMIGVFCAGAAMAYRRTPVYKRSRREGRRPPPVLPGAIVASVLWLAASIAFSFYLAEFNAYNETFGSLGAVAALLMWFWISAYAVGIGAELNVVIDQRRKPVAGVEGEGA
jgi:membrane protein